MHATVADAPSTGTRATLLAAAPLLVGIALMTSGAGLTSTLLGIRAGLEGFRPSVVGVVLAGYYVGVVVGSLVAPGTIGRVGHIRVFAGLASLMSAVVLLHVIRPEPLTWFVLRAVSGVCLASLYVVCETWLNGVATNRTRGTLMALYMVVISGSLLAGQLLFTLADPAGFAAFVLASVLVSMAVVPVSLANLHAPVLPEPEPMPVRDLWRVAPLAPVGAVVTGFIGSAILGGGVVYAADVGLNRLVTGLFIGAALVGGGALQVPLGNWSDRVDRRFVILVSSVAAVGVSLAIAAVGPSHRLVLIALMTVAGGTSYAVYSMVNAHLYDYLEDRLVVAGGARMVLVNGIGAVAGPIVGAAAVGQIGPGALFVVVAAAYATIAVTALVRIVIRPAAPEEDRAEFAPMPVAVGPTTAAMEAELDDVYEPSEGDVRVAGERVHYRDQGDGPPMVLLGRLEAHGPPWRDVLGPLAFDGYRAITAWSSRDGESPADVDGVLELLRHLELPAATFVGIDDGVEVVDALAELHADRVTATLVLALPGDPALTAEPDPDRPVLAVEEAHLADPAELADDIAEVVGNRWVVDAG